MKLFNKDKVSQVTVGMGEEDDFGDGRDFAKERRERQVWRHPYPDPLLDLP